MRCGGPRLIHEGEHMNLRRWMMLLTTVWPPPAAAERLQDLRGNSAPRQAGMSRVRTDPGPSHLRRGKRCLYPGRPQPRHGPRPWRDRQPSRSCRRAPPLAPPHRPRWHRPPLPCQPRHRSRHRARPSFPAPSASAWPAPPRPVPASTRPTARSCARCGAVRPCPPAPTPGAGTASSMTAAPRPPGPPTTSRFCRATSATNGRGHASATPRRH